MEVHKINKDRDYTVINNGFLKNRSLSMSAKGLLAIIMSLPDDWNFSIKGLAAISKEGETAIRSLVRELRHAGHCVYERRNGRGGTFDHSYTWYELPINVDVDELPPLKRKPRAQKPNTVEPYAAEPYVVKPHVVEPDVVSTHTYKVNSNKVLNNKLLTNKVRNNATREKTPLEKVSELYTEFANGETAFTAPLPVNGATLFAAFCQENGFKRLLSWPKPLNDQRFHQLKDQHGEAVFTAELEKINNVYSRTVKDCHRTVLNWFKRLQPPPPPHVETCYQIWRDGYRQKHGLYPTSSKFDNRNIEQMTAELAAMQPDQNVVDVWRQWCDMLFTMKPEGKNGFSWSPQLLTALSKNFSKITLDMKKSVNGGSLQSQAEKDADFMAEAMQEYERLQREKQNKYA